MSGEVQSKTGLQASDGAQTFAFQGTEHLNYRLHQLQVEITAGAAASGDTLTVTVKGGAAPGESDPEAQDIDDNTIAMDGTLKPQQFEGNFREVIVTPTQLDAGVTYNLHLTSVGR